MKKEIYLILIFILFSCSKEEHKEVNGQSYHELKSGHNIDFTLFSYNGRSPQKINIDSMVKLDKSSFQIFGYNSFYTIDTIKIFENSNKIHLSKYKFFNQEDEWGKLFEMKFRNAISITNDSFVAEYFDTHDLNGSTRTTWPDSGLATIKINP